MTRAEIAALEADPQVQAEYAAWCAEFCATTDEDAEAHAHWMRRFTTPEPTQARPDAACDIEYPIRRAVARGE